MCTPGLTNTMNSRKIKLHNLRLLKKEIRKELGRKCYEYRQLVNSYQSYDGFSNVCSTRNTVYSRTYRLFSEKMQAKFNNLSKNRNEIIDYVKNGLCPTKQKKYSRTGEVADEFKGKVEKIHAFVEESQVIVREIEGHEKADSGIF